MKNKTILLAFVIGIFMFSFASVSATILEYDTNTRTATFNNNFLFVKTGEIATAQLITPLNYKVGLGEQYVWEQKITGFDSYQDFISSMDFYDKKNGMAKINRDYDLRKRVVTPTLVDDYTCTDTIVQNGTIENECVVSGNHLEDRINYTPLKQVDFKKNDVLFIRMYTFVEEGDVVEWIPTMAGKRIPECATWTADLNTDIISYWKLDNNILTDSVGSNDGTNSGSTNISGKIISARSFDGTNDYITTSVTSEIIYHDSTVSMWVYRKENGGAIFTQRYSLDGGVVFNVGVQNGKVNFWLRNNTGGGVRQLSGATTMNNDEWNFITTTLSGTNMSVWLNGVYDGSATYTGGTWNNADNQVIGGNAGSGDSGNSVTEFFNGSVDEIGIWDRALTGAEITQLYNGGSGIIYPTRVFRIILNSPADSSISDTNLITFNATANITDGATLTNMSLWTNETGNWEEKEIFNITETITGDFNNEDNAFDNNVTTWADSPRFLISTSPSVTTKTIGKIGEGEYYVETVESIGAIRLDWSSIGIYTNYNVYLESYDGSSWNNEGQLLQGQYLTSTNSGNLTVGSFNNITTLNKKVSGIRIKFSLDDVGSYGGSKYATLYVNESKGIEIGNIDYQILTKTFSRTITDDIIWNVQACDSDGDCGFATSNYSLTIDTSAPTINIISPTGTYDSLVSGDTLYLSGFANDSNMDTCWYDYNNTNTTFSCTTETLFNESFTQGTKEQLNLTVWTNDSVGNVGTGTTGWDYKLFSTAEEYSAATFSSNNENFLINISYDSLIYLGLTANLVYNGTNYSATATTSGNITSIEKTLNIPTVAATENLPFYWEIFLNDGSTITTITTSSNNQSVSPLYAINITDLTCQAGYFEAVNFTFYDAENGTALSDNVDYNFQYGTGNYSSNLIYGEFLNITSFRICINSSVEDYKIGYGEVQYFSVGYSERRFYMYEDQTLSNSTTREYGLGSLLSADSTSFIFEIKNTYLNPYTDKLIALLRWYPGDNEYKVSEMAKTDADGKTVMKVKTEDVDYRVGVYEKDGTLIKLTDAVRMACLVNPCTYSLKIVQDPDDYYSVFEVETSLIFDEDTDRFVYSWNDPEQITSEMRLEVYKLAGNQDILICNETTSSYTGVMVCSIGTYTGDFYAKVYRSASPEKILSTLFHTNRDGVESSFGLFLAVILALATGLIGIASPVIAVILLIVGLIPALLFGSISIAIYMGIATLGGIVIHYMKKSAQ